LVYGYIAEGITVGIPGQKAQVGDVDAAVGIEELFVGQVYLAPVFFEDGASFTCQYYVARVPAYFIVPGIVVVLRCYQPAAM
jgi:hypothetical protein